MGLNPLWIKSTMAIALTFWLAPPLLAAAPTEISYTAAQTITIPYTFEPIPIPTPEFSLMPDFTDVTFINNMGSYALTVFSMLDALAFLGALVVIYLSVRVLIWLYGFVTDEPTDVEKLNVSEGLTVAGEYSGDEGLVTMGKVTKKSISFWKNPYRS